MLLLLKSVACNDPHALSRTFWAIGCLQVQSIEHAQAANAMLYNCNYGNEAQAKNIIQLSC